MSKKKTTKEFIDQATIKHNYKYDYSNTIYTTSKENVTIICPSHGKFLQQAGIHLSGAGCKECSNKINGDRVRQTTKTFIERSNRIHNNFYNYSKTIYTLSKNKVIIICPIHNEFKQVANSHLMGTGCRKCGFSLNTTNGHKREFKTRITQKDFIHRCCDVHGKKYDYSKTIYKGIKNKITIICPIHGKFEQEASNHVYGKGCSSCSVGGFDPNAATILYYLSINNGQAYKIGVTNLSIKQRYHKSDLDKITVIKIWNYELGKNAFRAEQSIIKEFSYARWDGDNLLARGGNTELFKFDILGLDTFII